MLEESLSRSSPGHNVLDPAACRVQEIGGELVRNLAGFAETTLPARLELILGSTAGEVVPLGG